MQMSLRVVLLFCASLLGVRPALADETTIAVAANFTAAAQEIAKAFHEQTGHTAVLAFGSTGKLYAQIAHGAPFEAFLAADDERPAKAVDEGLAVDGSRFTYAKGRIVLFSADPRLVDSAGRVLQSPDRFTRLAIANPATAPYGAAAIEALKALGVDAAVAPKLVQGDSIAQTYQFVATGNAQLGFVALSQVANIGTGSRWIVPESLYAPIRQDAVLLRNGQDSEAARAFLAFLKSAQARGIIESYGYALD